MLHLHKKILIIDDDTDMCMLLSRFLSKHGFETDMAYSGTKGLEKVKEGIFDVVLCDYLLGDKEGKDILIQIKNYNPNIIVLIFTGYANIKTAVDVIKLGAYDYITKPLIPDEVLSVIKLAIAKCNPDENFKKSIDTLTTKHNVSTNASVIGETPTTRHLYKQVETIAPTDYSIILYGESGTGKEVMAKMIHELSPRRNKPFVAMDCGTLSKELASSELFGHIKGSFTGAINDKIGHFEFANGGTLFLDEIANLSYDVQALLLRVIQERKFKRLGDAKEINTDVRIIVASHENLQEAYKNGKFREDLYHRFNEFSISLPALRNRKEDIPLFANFFLMKTNQELNKNVEGFDDEVINIFINYPWPGNIREFRNVVRRSVLLTDAGLIKTKTLPVEMQETGSGDIELASPNKPDANDATHLKNIANKAEYETIIKVLKQVNNNKSKAADILKIDRKTLYNKIKIYNERADLNF